MSRLFKITLTDEEVEAFEWLWNEVYPKGLEGEDDDEWGNSDELEQDLFWIISQQIGRQLPEKEEP